MSMSTQKHDANIIMSLMPREPKYNSHIMCNDKLKLLKTEKINPFICKW